MYPHTYRNPIAVDGNQRTMSNADLFTPLRLGAIELPNRVIMAPMTRSRAGAGNAVTPLTVEYYAQRASAGLIITEATQVSATGQGYPNTPGIHTDAQTLAWRAVAEAVHAKGGRIAAQLWHVGRVSHPVFQPGGAAPVAPSAIAANGELYTGDGMKPFPTPRALDTDEIPDLVKTFADAAKRAVFDAGLDGVEIHGANGYLIDQFLRDRTNRRTDRYGGSPLNRARFVVEALEAMAAAIGPGRVGFRISPGNPYNDMQDDEPVETCGALLQATDRLGLAYVHIINVPIPSFDPLPFVRTNWSGPVIGNNELTLDSARRLLADGLVDAVSFGRLFISNPDLVERFRRGAPLTEPDRRTFYAGEAAGFTDYPALDARMPLAANG